MGFGFYAVGSGLYEPTDGNLYAPRQPHGMPEFAPIVRYEGSRLQESPIPGRTPQCTIDDKLPRSYEARRTEAKTEKPYFFITDMGKYLQ